MSHPHRPTTTLFNLHATHDVMKQSITNQEPSAFRGDLTWFITGTSPQNFVLIPCQSIIIRLAEENHQNCIELGINKIILCQLVQ